MAFHSQPNNTMLTAYHREAGTMRVQCRHPAERYPGCWCPGTTFLVRPEYCIPRPSKYPEMVFYLTILVLVQFLGEYLESLGPHTIATLKNRTMMIYLINQRMESTFPNMFKQNHLQRHKRTSDWKFQPRLARQVTIISHHLD